MTPSNILVAGATGTNGRALLAELARRGLSARAFVRDPAKAADIEAMGHELAIGDLTDQASIERALTGMEKLYVVAAIRPDTVTLFHNAYAAAKAMNIRHVVKFSGFGADIASPSAVIRQHGESDAALIASVLPYTILRPNSFHQNMLWQAQSIRENRQFFLPLGSAQQSTVDVRDLAEATATILTSAGHENRIYELTGPESLSFFDVASQIGAAIDDTVTYFPVSVEAAEQAMRDNGMPEWDAHVLAEIQGLFATGAYASAVPDLATLLGHPPRSFARFVADHVEAFR